LIGDSHTGGKPIGLSRRNAAALNAEITALLAVICAGVQNIRHDGVV
jgi:hypothetical protein